MNPNQTRNNNQKFDHNLFFENIDDISQILINAFIQKNLNNNKNINLITLISSILLIYKIITESHSLLNIHQLNIYPKNDIQSLLNNINEIPCHNRNNRSNFDKLTDIINFVTTRYSKIDQINLTDIGKIFNYIHATMNT
tara:strand:+ start:1610 stop:2029 length:420 start_codon:yes stop_codon:yes gene_type:complete